MSKTLTLTQDMSNQTVDTYLYPEGDLSGCTEFTSYASNGEGNYSCVDENREIPDDDDTYVYWNQEAIGVDLYELASKKNFGVINYIQVYSRAKSTDNPQAPEGTYKIICSLDSACTVVYKSDNVNLTTGYKTYYKVWTENPATSIAWSWGDINLLCIGEECSSPTYTTTQTLTLKPNSLGTTTELSTYNCTNNYECVNEETLDTSDYVSNPLGQDDWDTDLYNMDNHTTETGTISKIVLFYVAQSAGGETPQTCKVRSRIRTGGIEYNGTEHLCTFPYQIYSDEWILNPDTSIAWTWDDIDALECGIDLYYGTGFVPRCQQLYLVVHYAGQVEPEIRTTQCYAKVNSSPSDTVCELNFPEEVSTNHSRNVKMMNMWNGNREVYDLNRSGKSMLLTGKEIDYECTQEAVQRIQCVRDMGIVGADIVIDDFDLNVFNGTYKIRSFNWIKVSKYPLVFEWVLELEDSEL